MKTINMKWTCMIALAAVSAALTSCKDEPDKYESTSGTPTVYYIRPVDVSSKDSLLTSAAMETPVCLVGDNLRSIKAVMFNDQQAVLNTSYMTDHTLIVSVPKTIPSVVSDKLYMVTTGNDTIPYDFKVIVPAPTVMAMSNEWADAGQEVTITGDYFLDYDNYPLEINVGNNYKVPRSAITSISKTSITFTMPEDMPAHEKITVTSKYGTTKAPFEYMDNRGMLFDFDTAYDGTNVLGNHGWHTQKIQTDATSLSGNYLLLGDADMDAAGSWNDGNFSFEYWAGTWSSTFDGDGPKLNDVADFSNWTGKSLKFEILVPSANPWRAAPMQIIFAGTDKITLFQANNTFFHNGDGWGRALYMPWYNDNTSFDTGDKWVTVTIPFTDFNKDWDGNAAAKMFTSVEDFASLTIFVVSGGYNDKTVIPDGVDCHPIIKIDNIRVVPNK
ncbi:MAG: IPT/TIG domain-containing protein [Prevotella sp.]|nr:IPT/TIG domain-containing protein [Prevotella sp.]